MGNAGIEDFISIQIGIGIVPAAPLLHVGSRVCFTTQLTGEIGTKNQEATAFLVPALF